MDNYQELDKLTLGECREQLNEFLTLKESNAYKFLQDNVKDQVETLLTVILESEIDSVGRFFAREQAIGALSAKWEEQKAVDVRIAGLRQRISLLEEQSSGEETPKNSLEIM